MYLIWQFYKGKEDHTDFDEHVYSYKQTEYLKFMTPDPKPFEALFQLVIRPGKNTNELKESILPIPKI